MDTFGVIQSISSLALAVLTWFLPNCVWYWKVIIILCILLLSSAVYCFRLIKRLEFSEQQKKDVEERHQALARQFDQKVDELKQYRKVFGNLNLMLHIALQNTKQAKLEDIYRAFIIDQQELNDGGGNNE